MKRRSVVRTSGRIPHRGRPVIWGYGLADLAVLLGVSVQAVRKLVQRRRFDPGDLASVTAYLVARMAKNERPTSRRKAET